jgi:hypothetical protein
MPLHHKFFAASLLGALTLSGCGKTDPQGVDVPPNFTGKVTLECHQKIAEKDPRYLFSATANLVAGNLQNWTVARHSPFTPAISSDLEMTFTRMSAGISYIKNRDLGFEISASKEFKPNSTLYVTKEMKNALFVPFGRSSELHFYCSPKI